MTKDMTSGSPMKLILGFSVPLLFGFCFSSFIILWYSDRIREDFWAWMHLRQWDRPVR